MINFFLDDDEQLNNKKFIDSLKKAKQISIQSELDQDGQRQLSSKIKESIQLEKLILFVQRTQTESIRYQLIKSLESLVNLTDLSLDIANFRTEDARNLGKLFRKLQKLDSLTLKQFADWDIKAEGIIGLQKGFQQLKKLRKFSISLSLNSNIQLEDIRQIALSLNSLTHLTIEADFTDYGEQESSALHNLISQQINLTHLYLNVESKGILFHNDWMRILGDSLKHLYDLTHLKIEIFINSGIWKKQFVSFKNNLSKIHNLVEFTFQYSVCNKINDDPLFILEGLQMHKKLRKVKLISKIVGDQNNQYFSRIPQVKELYLDFNFMDLDVLCSRNLCYGFRCFENLTILKLTFEKQGKKSISEIVREFGKALKRMKKLINLDLRFYENCELALGATQKIGRGISKLKNLENLSLLFEADNYIQEEGAKSIGDALKQLSNLINFKFQIGRNNQISSEGMKGLSEGIQCLQNLQKLQITKYDDDYPESDDLKYFGESLLNLKNLKELNFEFPSNLKIDSAKVFNDCLITLKNLQSLTLYFQDQIRLIGISQMLKQLNCLNALEKIKIKFQKINYDFIKTLFQSFSKAKNLKSVELHFFLNFQEKPLKLANYIQNMNTLQELIFDITFEQVNYSPMFINLFKRKMIGLVKFQHNLSIQYDEYNEEDSSLNIFESNQGEQNEESFNFDEENSYQNQDNQEHQSQDIQEVLNFSVDDEDV